MWTLVGLVGLATSACGGGDDLTTADQTTTTKEPVTTTAPARTVAKPTMAECTDPAGDATGGADLVKVSLGVDGSMLTATYELGGDVGPAPDGASWVILVKQGAGDEFESYQLGLKIVGDEVSRFLFDFGASKQQNFDTPYSADGRRVVASFPVSALGRLRGEFSWSAVTTFAGDDADQCPAEGTAAFTL